MLYIVNMKPFFRGEIDIMIVLSSSKVNMAYGAGNKTFFISCMELSSDFGCSNFFLIMLRFESEHCDYERNVSR